MDSLGLVFLGVIALASLVQGAFLVGLALGGLRLAQNLAAVSEIATGQARRLESLVAHTVERVEEARSQVRTAVEHPLGAFSDVGAILKGFRRGLDVYQRLGGLSAQ